MADDQTPHDWQLLSCICNSLGRPDHPLYQPLAHDDYPREYRLLALEGAFRTGVVPIRGQRVTAFGLGPPERIEDKLDAETAIDILLDEITLRLVATDFTPAPRRPIRSPRKWKPSKEWVKREIELFGSVLAERKLRAERDERQFSDLSMIALSAAGTTRAKKRDLSPPCLEFAVFQRVEADTAIVEQLLRSRNGKGCKSPFPKSRLPELKSFVLDFDRKQESAGGSRNEKTARAAAQKHFAAYIITRIMVRAARTAAGCLGKPGIKPIHAAK